MEMWPIETDRQITVQEADTARRSGAGQFISRAFDDRTKDDLVPIRRKGISQKFLQVLFIQRQRPGLFRPLATFQFGNDRVLGSTYTGLQLHSFLRMW